MTETTDAAAVHQAVEDAVARERARMARELHDTVATDLAANLPVARLSLPHGPPWPMVLPEIDRWLR